MATKTIKAWVNGAVQNIEVEDMVSPETMPSVEERLEALEDKSVITDGNFLVGDGTTEPEEMTPEEALSHINGASVVTLTSAEYEALGNNANANFLYGVTDGDEIEIPAVNTDDEGAFLRVIDNAPQWAIVGNAEETSF